MIDSRALPPNDHYATPGHATPDGGWARPVMARHAGRDDTLHPDPAGIGTWSGWMGRDVENSGTPYMSEPGLFRRLHGFGSGG